MHSSFFVIGIFFIRAGSVKVWKHLFQGVRANSKASNYSSLFLKNITTTDFGLVTISNLRMQTVKRNVREPLN